MGNDSAGHVWGMGSKSTEKHEITEIHFFLPLASASYTFCVPDVSGSFLLLPLSPLPCSLCPSEFPWDFILAVSNRIGTQFVMLHVTLLANTAVNIETS